MRGEAEQILYGAMIIQIRGRQLDQLLSHWTRGVLLPLSTARRVDAP